MKRISEDIKNSIIDLIDQGISSRQIARQLGVGSTTVDKVKSTHRPNKEKPKGGRPEKLTRTDKRHLVRLATSLDNATATRLAGELGESTSLTASPQTVRNALKQAGLKSAVKVKRPLLAPRHIRARLEFAKKYLSWTKIDWRRVVFSDETKVNRLGSDGRQWVWKKPGASLKSQHVQGTVKFGGGSLMLWGCMTARGVGFACRIDGGMDSALYCQILGDEFLQTLEYYGLEKDQIVFQQDNDPKHTSAMAKRWFADNGIEVLDWPPQSPDLNPIEHLWWHLKKRLNSYENEPASIHELWGRAEKEWNDIPVAECVKLIDSMVGRVAAVFKAGGGYTDY